MKCELCKNPDGKKRIMKINRGGKAKMDIEFVQCDICFNKIKERIKIK